MEVRNSPGLALERGADPSIGAAENETAANRQVSAGSQLSVGTKDNLNQPLNIQELVAKTRVYESGSEP